MSEGLPRKISASEATVEELRDLDNASIRGILEGLEVAKQGDAITADDYEAIRSRVAVLVKERDVPVSTNALLSAAYIDRMKHVEQLSDESIKAMPSDTIRGYIYAETGIDLNHESIEGFRKSNLDLKNWVQGWAAAQEKPAKDFDVAVNEEGAVIARGSTREEALRAAQDKSR